MFLSQSETDQRYLHIIIIIIIINIICMMASFDYGYHEDPSIFLFLMLTRAIVI